MANQFDPANAPSTEPTEFTVGDYVQWKRVDFVGDYPTASHSVQYIARSKKGGSSEFTVSATEVSDGYLFTISSTESASISADAYHWQLEITQTSSGNRLVLEDGDFDVIVDLDDNNADPRIFAQIMADKIESLLSGKADSDVSSYSIAGRSLTKMSFQELIDAREFYRGEVVRYQALELAKRGKTGSATIKARF
tara:strand:+ start:28 stop:612 length:585 start_codon:yes stop_codon:yes gene_type:complete